MPWHAESVDQGETGHALLALLSADDGLLRAELERRGIEPEAVSRELNLLLPRRSRARERAETGARFIAEALAAGKLSREVLVRSVLSDYWGVAGQVFRGLATRNAEAGGAGAPALKAPLVQLDDASDRTIYEQIVAQVREGIATGRLLPGERLPTVRELADQLGIAPGTVARAYSELERESIVVTQGVRGTRVAGRLKTSPDPAVRPESLTGLLRPAAVAAFHMGASAGELRAALEAAMRDIFPPDAPAQA